MYAVCSCVVGWVVVVVLVQVVGGAGCFSLLFMKSLSIASHFELSSAEVSHVMSLEVFRVCGNLVAWLILLGSSWRRASSSGLRGAWPSSLPPVDPGLPEHPRRDSGCCKQVVRFVCFSLYVVDPRFWLVSRQGLLSWLLCSVARVAGDIDARVRGLRSCATCTCLSLCLYDHSHHPSLGCLELLLHIFRHRRRS